MTYDHDGRIISQPSPSRPDYNHHKSLSGSSNDLLRIATQNHLVQQNHDGERERQEPYKSVVSPNSAYTTRSLSSSNRYSWIERESMQEQTVPNSGSSTSPFSQRTFILDGPDNGTLSNSYSSPGDAIGESPRDPSSKQKRKKGSSGANVLGSTGPIDRAGSSFHGFWSSARTGTASQSPGRQNTAAAATSFSPSATILPSKNSRDIDSGFTFPVAGPSRLGDPINIQDLVRSTPQSTFLDLTNGSRQTNANHNRAKTEPAPARSLFASRLFSGHRDSSQDGVSQLPIFRHSRKGHGKSASLSASPSISAPFGVSIAAYRPVPTHSTAARVSRSLVKPDLRTLDPSNAILMPAGPSHMQKQVEDLESRRMLLVSRLHQEGNGLRTGTAPGRPVEVASATRHAHQDSGDGSGLRPIAAISDAQLQRGGSDHPVHWMRTGLSRSASQEAVHLLQPTRWEARNGCEQLVLPRPKLVAHTASPPATPEQVQRERAFKAEPKGKVTHQDPVGDVLVIDRQKYGVTFGSTRTPSPALSGIRVMDEGAERERERQEWARSVGGTRKRSVRRPRSNSLGAGTRSPHGGRDLRNQGDAYFTLPRSPDNRLGPVTQKSSPPISTSFGFLPTTASLRSRSRSATSSSRKTGGNTPRQFGSTSTEAQSFRNAPRDYGSIGRASEDPFAVPIPRTPSQNDNRLSRNHSSPDLRRAAACTPDWSQGISDSVDPLQTAGPDSSTDANPGNTIRPITPLWFSPRTNGTAVRHSRGSSNLQSDNHSQRLVDANEVRTRYLTLSEPPVLGPELPLSPARTTSLNQVYSPARSTSSGVWAEPLPPHTARALASRLSNSPRRMKSSLEEAVNRARTSAMLLYGEDPELFATTGQVNIPDTFAASSSIPPDRREILEAAGILPQNASRKYLTPVTEGNESNRSASSIGKRPGTEQSNRGLDDSSPLLTIPRGMNAGSSEASPAISDLSPRPSVPMDELDQYDQELFFAKPRMTWSSPLAYPVPGSASRSSPRSPPNYATQNQAGRASANSHDRASGDSAISRMLSTPTTGEGHRASQDISAENAGVEVATPVLAYGEYGWAPNRGDGLDLPFEMRVDAASPNALDRQASHATLHKEFGNEYAPWTREENKLFQGSPYQTQTEDGSDGEFAFGGRQSLIHKSSSENTSLHVGTVPSATPAHRSPSMDQLSNKNERGHVPRASVVPEFVIGGSPSTYYPSQPPTPNVDQKFTTPGLPRFESNSSASSGRSMIMPANHSATPSPETPTNLFRQPGGIATIAREFPAPPSRSASYLSNVYPEPEQEDKRSTSDGLAMKSAPKNDLPLIPPIRRLETDFSAMTGNSYATATEGYETDDNDR